MRITVQRVRHAKCLVDGSVTGEIGKGLLLFIGIHETDTKEIADKMLEKIKNLRIFEDENGKTNLNAEAVGGGALLISQFTLYADCRKGNRPSFIGAAAPAFANELYEYMIQRAETMFQKVGTGIFGADMQIELINDGPFTLNLDSDFLNMK